jgi:hypothetical protein
MLTDDYIKARKLAKREYRKAVSERRSPHLPVLSEILPNYQELQVESLGCFEIPISLIAGTLTKGRKESFALNFLPLLSPYSEFAVKWQNLLASQMDEGIRDEIRVYEYMAKFYVIEGNKRVSVMKYLKQPSILANVVRLIPKNIDTPEYKIYSEFLKFYKCTSFYGLYFSKEGSFQKLADILGTNLYTRWSSQVVMDFKSAYITFGYLISKKYDVKSIELLSDLFLEYISEFGINSLLDDMSDDIKKKFELMCKNTTGLSKIPSPLMNEFDDNFNKIVVQFRSIFSKDNDDGDYQ